MPITITEGLGKDRPQGRLIALPSGSPVDIVASALSALSTGVESWWSPHRWARDYRLAKEWLGSSAIAIDIDYETREERELLDRKTAHQLRREPVPADIAANLKAVRERKDPPPTELVDRIDTAARSGELPGSLWHLTPHGARLVFVLPEECTDADAYRAAARGAGALTAAAIAPYAQHEAGCYRIDAPLLEDLGRLYYAPRANAKGVQRNADVSKLRAEPYTLDGLAEHDIGDAAPASAKPTTTTRSRSVGFAEAKAKWNADHRREYPRHSSECPVCFDGGSFGHLPDDPERWFCFSTDHPSGVGIPGSNGYHGDALDLEAHARGCKAVDVLRADGYLGTSGQVLRLVKTDAPTHVVGFDIPEERTTRSIYNNSFLAACTILRRNLHSVLGKGGRLRLNEMTGRQELDGRSLQDEDVFSIRALIELRFEGSKEKGLKLSATDVHNACDLVAYENKFHPVQDYLRSLEWDGIPRIDAVVEDILGAKRDQLNQALVRRFFISAVARAMQPGCKVDTVLVLVGLQGARKSTFFNTLAGSWFIDTNVDLRNKDAYQVLRNAWIYEWGELEVLRRTKDANTAKAFLSSRIDTYRPSHGRKVVDVPRSCVIVGSTNEPEFLSDPTGNRRFWPLRVGSSLDIQLLEQQRDQLWAEARVLFEKGEPWWLTDAETALLAEVHEEHAITDPWETPVLSWADRQVVEFGTAEALTGALEKPRGQWTRADEMRVANLLRGAGWALGKKPVGAARRWARRPSLPPSLLPTRDRERT